MMPKQRPSDFLKAASKFVIQEHSGRLAWIEGERSSASGVMLDVVNRTADSVNKAMWTWHEFIKQLGHFYKATTYAMQTSGESFKAQLAVFDVEDESIPIETRQMALAMRQLILSHEGHVQSALEIFSDIVTLSAALGTAGLAYVVSTRPPAHLKVIIERMPNVAKNLGAAAVLGPVKDLVEAITELARKDSREQEDLEGAANWHKKHERLTNALELWTPRLTLMTLLVIRDGGTIKALASP